MVRYNVLAASPGKMRIKVKGARKKMLFPIGWPTQGCAWVGLREFFYITHHGGLKKIQPNPTHIDRVRLG